MTSIQLPLDDPANDPAETLWPLATELERLITDHGFTNVERELAFFAPPKPPVPSAPARWTDPETSHQAAKRDPDVRRFSAKSRQAKLLALFDMRDLTDQGATIHLVGSQAPPSAFDGCRRRCSDLRAAGYIADTGRRKKNTGSDDLSIIWRITESGKRALRSLEETGWSR
jgi:hypothetical protein